MSGSYRSFQPAEVFQQPKRRKKNGDAQFGRPRSYV